MSSALGERLKHIREAEGFSQAKFADLTGISISTIKKYEIGLKDPGGVTLIRVTTHEKLKKYTLWLMTGETNETAGQVSPALSLDGSENTSSRQSGNKAG